MKAKPSKSTINKAKAQQLAEKLEVELTEDILSLPSNDAVSQALLEKALENGKS